jgi:mono/diheme cytochrome c family protein
VRNWSIAHHSTDIEAPPLDGAKLVQDGAAYYHRTCRLCHGAPRLPRSQFAIGLYPVPPGLTSEETKGLRDTELYWIVKNGIKMTAMPSFGVTHADRDLWCMVAFLRHYPELTVKEYEGLTGFEESCDPE